MRASPCGNGVEGCLHDEDCLDGGLDMKLPNS